MMPFQKQCTQSAENIGIICPGSGMSQKKELIL